LIELYSRKKLFIMVTTLRALIRIFPLRNEYPIKRIFLEKKRNLCLPAKTEKE